MLQKDTLDFLTTLKENNDREWFNENKQWYERSRADLEQLVAKLISAVAVFDPEIAYLTPKKCIFRIYRDEDALQRVPNGFDSNHPAAEYLKLKHFYVLKPVTQEQVLSPGFVDYAASVYKKMKPFGEYMTDLLRE